MEFPALAHFTVEYIAWPDFAHPYLRYRDNNQLSPGFIREALITPFYHSLIWYENALHEYYNTDTTNWCTDIRIFWAYVAMIASKPNIQCLSVTVQCL